jgi:hypothetical protein
MYHPAGFWFHRAGFWLSLWKIFAGEQVFLLKAKKQAK